LEKRKNKGAENNGQKKLFLFLVFGFEGSMCDELVGTYVTKNQHRVILYFLHIGLVFDRGGGLLGSPGGKGFVAGI